MRPAPVLFASRLRRPFALFGALLGALSLTACQSTLQNSDSFMGVITPYKVEIVQGNVITKEQAALAKVGMTRSQVRDVLGSPLLTDIFHANRWDYVFTIRRQGTPPQAHHVMLVFENDTLKSIDTGGDLPGEHDFVASIDTFKTSRNAPPLVLTDEQMKSLRAPAPTLPPQVEPSGPNRAYPPLEPNS